jgi:hypothetical protein
VRLLQGFPGRSDAIHRVNYGVCAGIVSEAATVMRWHGGINASCLISESQLLWPRLKILERNRSPTQAPHRPCCPLPCRSLYSPSLYSPVSSTTHQDLPCASLPSRLSYSPRCVHSLVAQSAVDSQGVLSQRRGRRGRHVSQRTCTRAASGRRVSRVAAPLDAVPFAHAGSFRPLLRTRHMC